MRERSEQWLRISCWVVGAVLLLQIVRTLANVNPLAHLRIPELPTFSAAASGKGTNTPASSNSLGKATNIAVATSPSSNSPAAAKIEQSGTNAGEIRPLETNRPQAAVAEASPNSAVEKVH